MIGSLKNVAKVPDLRGKILFTLAIIALYRLGTRVPVPGINFAAIQELTDATNNSDGGILPFLQLFSGGALTNFAVFGLGIMPYITSSIIIQLLTVVIPKLEQWRNEGVTGQKKITQTTRYLTLVLAVMQATGITVALHNNASSLGVNTSQPLLTEFDIPHVLLIVLTMTTGCALVMWLGELITQRGIGQGMSILIFANVVSTMPAGFNAVRLTDQGGNFKFATIVAISLVLLVAIVFIEQGQRRIPIQFAKRVVGKRQYGGQSSYIPLKVNQSGIIPIIFASSVLAFPLMVGTVLPTGIRTWLSNNLAQADSPYYIAFYGLLIVGFAYFYTRIVFDPIKQADIIRKQGGYIPGIRPGRPTEQHLTGILNRITLPGSLWLAAIALIPSLALAIWNINNYPFAGTTLLIAVGVALETMKQVDSQLTMRNYEGFLK
jgi:preprotein translocase subunit SecY